MMKKIGSVLGVLLVAGSVVFAGGKENPSTVSSMAIIKQGTVVKVLYKPEKLSVARISVENSKGAVIFTEYIRTKNGFSRPINIKRLPEGKYTVRISDGSGEYQEEIEVSYNKRIAFKVDKLTSDENKYALFIPNTDVKEVDVRIYSQGGELLYKATEAIQQSFARVYNLKNVKGDVHFVVTPK